MHRNLASQYFVWAKRNINFILFSVFICSLFLIYRLGSNSFWMTHDNLNSEIIFKILPVQEDVFFRVDNEAYVNRYMGKIPKCSYSSNPFSIISWFFYLFPANLALLIVSFLGRMIAFSGIYFLLNRLTIYKSQLNTWTIFFLSFGFAALPFYTIHGWAIMGLPWCIFFFLRIISNQSSGLDYLCLLLYGLSGSFVLGGFAVCMILGILAIYYLYKKKNFSFRFLLATSCVAMGLILSDFGLFYQFLFKSDFVSHRSIWEPECNWSLKVVLYDAYTIFKDGQYHAPSKQLPFILFLGLACFVIPIRKLFKLEVVILLGLILSIAFLHALYKSELIAPVKKSVEILNQFQFDRFYFLFSVVWVLLFFLSYRNHNGIIRFAAFLTAIFYAYFSFSSNDEWLSNIKGHCINDSVKQWDAYYYENLGEAIDSDFSHKNGYRVVHFGLDPAIGCYLGFHTIDGYHTNYPLEIKSFFQQIIKLKEKENSAEKHSMLSWGSNLRYFPTRSNHMDLDWNLAKKNNVKYILARHELSPSAHYTLYKKYSDDMYNQALFVYEIIGR